MRKAAIYHFTNVSEKRPAVYKETIKQLREYACGLGYQNFELYCDMSIKRHERSEFDRLLAGVDQYEVLIVKDYYHISKNTGSCVNIIRDLQDKGINVYAANNGCLTIEQGPLNKDLKIATYTSYYGTDRKMAEAAKIKNDILKLFIDKKTEWILSGQYTDHGRCPRDSEQKELQRLLKANSQYDLLVVHKLSDLSWRTSNFFRIRDKLHLDIYSLQQGFIPYRKGV